MSAIVGCESVLAGWESFCPFVLLSKSGCYFVGTTLIFVGTAVDYGRTSRALLSQSFLQTILYLLKYQQLIKKNVYGGF